MDKNEFGQALLDAIEVILARRGDLTLTLTNLRRVIHEALEPGTEKQFDRPPSQPQLPVEPEYPRLKVKYDRTTGQALEYKVIYGIKEEIPMMSGGWYRRPMSELEQIKKEAECAA